MKIYLPFTIQHSPFNLIPEFIQKGTRSVPFCIPTLYFLLCSLCFNVKKGRGLFLYRSF